MWVTRLSIVDWVYFKTLTLLATLRTRNQLQVESEVSSETLVSFSWMCKKQTSVSHSSTESEIISLDAGLRMDGLFVFEKWDVVIEVLRSSKSTKTPIRPVPGNWCGTGNHSSNKTKTKTPTKMRNRDVDQLSNVDFVQILLKVSLSCTSLKTMRQ